MGIVEGHVRRDDELRRVGRGRQVRSRRGNRGGGDGDRRALSGHEEAGGGAADTLYCALPAPVTPLIDQLRLALPLLLTVKVCAAGAAPPQLATNEREVGVTAGPPPMLAPESGRGAGGAAQTPVAVIVMLPVLAPAAALVGTKVTASVCVPLAGMLKVGVETAKGEPPDPVERVTVAGPVPVFTTLKFWDAAWRRTTCPKLPKFGVADVSKARTAPRGSSVSVMVCDAVSASVWIVSVAETGVVGERAGTAGACTAKAPEPPAGITTP